MALRAVPNSTRPLCAIWYSAHEVLRVSSSQIRPAPLPVPRPPPLDSTGAATTEKQLMNVRPLHDRIIVQRLVEGEQQIGGIIIPDSAKEKPQQGKVLAVGNGKTNDEGTRIPLDVKPGNLILFGKYSGQEIKLDGEEYLIVKEDEVLAVIESEPSRKPAEGSIRQPLAALKSKIQKRKR